MGSIWDDKIVPNDPYHINRALFAASAPNSEAALKVIPSTPQNSAAVDRFLQAIKDHATDSSKGIDGKPIEAAFGNKQTVARLQVLAEKDPNAFNDVLAQAEQNPNNFGNSIDAHYLKDYPAAAAPTPAKAPAVATAPPAKKPAAAPPKPAVASTKPTPTGTTSPSSTQTTTAPAPGTDDATAPDPNADPAAAAMAANAANPPAADPAAGADDGGDIAKLLKSLPAIMQMLNFLADSNIPILSGLAKAIKGFMGGPMMAGVLGAVGIDPKSLGLNSDPTKPSGNAVLSDNLANNAIRASYLGNLVNDEEAKKADNIVDKNGQKIGTYSKLPDGSYTATLTMPDGSKERWDKVFQETDPTNGSSLMAFERRTADGKVYLGADGKPQVILSKPGNMGTEQDIAAMHKIVYGQPAPELFASTAQQTEHFYQYEQQVAAARGSAMPNITLSGHSMGNYAIGAVTQQLATHNIEPDMTIKDAPVGAGAGVEYLAKAGNPTDAEALNRFNQLTKNVVIFQPQGTFESMPGGGTVNANGTPAQVALGFKAPAPASSVPNTAPGALPGNLLNSSGHELSALGNYVYQNGPGSFSALPSTPASAFLNDTTLPPDQQKLAETGVNAFAGYIHSQHPPTNATSTTNFMAPVAGVTLAAAATDASPTGPLATVKPNTLGASMAAERERQNAARAGGATPGSPGATVPGDLEARKAIRASYLGSLIDDETAQKADGIVDAAGHKIGTHDKLPNGNYTATLTMPDGSKERYDEVIRKADSTNGSTLIVFERRNLDGGIFRGPNGQIPVVPVKIGGAGTQQDIDLIHAHLNKELTTGQPLFETTASTVNPGEEPRKTSMNVVPLFPNGGNYNGVLKGGAPLLQPAASPVEPSLVAQLDVPSTGATPQAASQADPNSSAATAAAAAAKKKFPQLSPFGTPGGSFS